MNPINVLYIASNGRSGSTILDMTLGQINEFHSIGEMRLIWMGVKNNHLCGCGCSFEECPLWVSIFNDAFGGFDYEFVNRMLHLSKTYCNGRYLPHMFLPTGKAWLENPDIQFFIENTLKLYQSIQKITGCNWIVDSSKFALYAYMMASTGMLNMYIVHLLRDPRGVAYSLRKKRWMDHGAFMHQENIVYSSMKWNVYNILIEMLGSKGLYTQVKYRDFVNNPAGIVEKILEPIQVSDPLDFIDGNIIQMEQTHTASGNPVRLNNSNQVDLISDEEWREKLKTSDKWIVNALTALPRLRYDYS